MQSAIAHALGTAAHARARIRGAVTAPVPDSVDQAGPSSSLRFSLLAPDGSGSLTEPLATSVSGWIEHLRGAGCTAVHVMHAASGGPVPDWRSVGFAGGGGRWLILATLPDGVETWQAVWARGGGGDGAAASWSVEYVRISAHVPGRPFTIPIPQPYHRVLFSALAAAADFARERRLEPFAEHFAEARGILYGHGTGASRLLEGLPVDGAVRRLAAAAEHAWVFGGMGSWNDVAVDVADSARYAELSAQLYGALTSTLEFAVNCVRVRPRWRLW